ncbi:UDP-N-acetylmuramoyl-L-alanyl-D-glutamate--2,6-diaminopimelate ligase [Candidatus Hartigia pinicola]|nr:UDP-N-acetylmuramoyl-L-alanyl-D-glutamate--2,6-diaminopimelate ligase [Candidatus Hartigia pinicola]
MTDRNLADLLAPFGISTKDILLREMIIDSRKTTKNDLFIAIKGHKSNGLQYISHAINRGVSAVIAETKDKTKDGTISYINGIPIIYLYSLNHRLSSLAGKFYQNPARKMKLTGVTGTNGKTTTTHLIAKLAKGLGEISAVMGTIGNGLLGQITSSENTTSSAVNIQAELYQLLKHKVTLTAIEVSSHGLVQNRVSALPFNSVIFTNLSHDHLDYHGDMKNYEAAKWLLFSTHQTKTKIINADDDIGLKWLHKLPTACAVSIKKHISNHWEGPWLKASTIHYHDHGATIHFNSSWGGGTLDSPLIGRFNASNLLLAMASLLMMNYPLEKVLTSSKFLSPVCGRMERFHVPNKPTVVIDYAHTPDALEQALSMARLNCKRLLLCIFGCGGERDKKKRPLMGRIAEKWANKIILTNDNPRSEKPLDIINDIISGIVDASYVLVIPNRSEAIKTTILQAGADDLILIAGKGHENYQIIGNRRLYHSDRFIVTRLLRITA